MLYQKYLILSILIEMSSVLNSEANSSYISYPSPPPLATLSSNTLFIDPDLQSSPIPASQQTLTFDQIPAENPSPPNNSQLDILSNKQGANKCVRYPDRKDVETEMEFVQKRDGFINWWKTTPSAARFEKRGKYMQWGGSKRSHGWQHFIEVARFEDGTPQVRCIHCNILINHPGTGNGTKTMNAHPQSQQCGYKGIPGSKNTSIKDFISKGSVSLHL